MILLDDKIAVMGPGTFKYRFHEYSLSLPTGTTPGRMWRRRIPWRGEDAKWYLGEYYDVGSLTDMGIRWREIHVVDDQGDADWWKAHLQCREHWIAAMNHYADNGPCASLIFRAKGHRFR